MWCLRGGGGRGLRELSSATDQSGVEPGSIEGVSGSSSPVAGDEWNRTTGAARSPEGVVVATGDPLPGPEPLIEPPAGAGSAAGENGMPNGAAGAAGTGDPATTEAVSAAVTGAEDVGAVFDPGSAEAALEPVCARPGETTA